ncbi:MAG: ABC transporter permease subunit [Ilumatobacter sp.]|nr:MAG: ABC transporter permease subunit [Ilumatobacter sp.]
MSRGARVAIAGVIGLTAFLIMWELGVRVLDVQPFVLQAPSRIVTELVDRPGLYLGEALVTARHAGLGLVISLTVALLLGAVLASSRFAEDAMQPVLVLVLVTPWVSYFVSLVIWLGPGDRPVVFLVAFVTAPVLTFAVTSGLRSADPAARELLASVDAGWWEVMWRLRLPSALPTIFASSRFAVALALAAAYFGEGGNLRTDGLGYLGRVAANSSLAQQLWATIATTALLGIVMLTALTVVERMVLRWHPSQIGIRF